MSRSYKKHSFYKFIIRGSKRRASKAVRRYKGDITNGCHYKRIYQSWNVIDERGYRHNAKRLFKELRHLIPRAFSVLFGNDLSEEEFYDLKDEITDRFYLRIYFKK